MHINDPVPLGWIQEIQCRMFWLPKNPFFSLSYYLYGIQFHAKIVMVGKQVTLLSKIFCSEFCSWMMKDTTTLTRMHSSRMRTAHLLPVSPSMHCSGVYLLWGCTWSWGVYLVPGCVPGPGGCTWSREGGTCPGTPPCEQNDWQTGVKIIPCPKLRLRGVTSQIMNRQNVQRTVKILHQYKFSVCSCGIVRAHRNFLVRLN